MFEDKARAVYYRVTETAAEPVHGLVIGESRWTLFVNEVEVVTFMATPLNLQNLAIGFLASENFITAVDEIASLRVNQSSDRAYWFIPALGVDEVRPMPTCEQGVGTIQVRLNRKEFALPPHRVLTSGCGGGVTFDDLSAEQTPLDSKRALDAARLLAIMRELNAQARLYRECRGVHTSALSDGETLISLAECRTRAVCRVSSGPAKSAFPLARSGRP
ncbi:MAG: formate dehydrogenase accessory sulfurtransferase FdhD [Chloroflexi bacterium]|nr:formate dehydrogenase accessory sulfurtransferase FdhD [Chloroflexota bacterium]